MSLSINSTKSLLKAAVTAVITTMVRFTRFARFVQE